MNKAQGLAALGLLLVSCKGASFNEQSDGKQDSTIMHADDDEDQVIALEPSPIGGSFLGCFVDPQIEPELLQDQPLEGVAIGCQTFENRSFTRVHKNDSFVVERGAIRIGDREQSLMFQALNTHFRWNWVTRVPAEAQMDSLQLQVRADPGTEAVSLRVELSDSLPPVLAMDPELLKTGSYKLRVKGTDQCLHGNPIWRLNIVTQKPIAEAIPL
jgi:hypothetical protein